MMSLKSFVLLEKFSHQKKVHTRYGLALPFLQNGFVGRDLSYWFFPNFFFFFCAARAKREEAKREAEFQERLARLAPSAGAFGRFAFSVCVLLVSFHEE
jgi:hypothetical protein